jgi:vacuolar protein-sorting-associated protein 4
MYSNFKEQAIEYVKQAVHEDNAGNYAKAFPLYMNALEYFKTHLKYEKNPKIREAITQRFTDYLRRAEEIRAVLDDGGPGPASNGDAAVATRPKSKPKDGSGGGGGGEGGGDGEDPEQAKLRAGLNSAIIREKPNVKWNDVAGLESAKQALQEAVILPVKFPQFFTGWLIIVVVGVFVLGPVWINNLIKRL